MSAIGKLKTPLSIQSEPQKMVVADKYRPPGGEDLKLGNGFHETAQGIRFTVSESARREVLSRLLRLDHERWEEEQKVKDDGGMMKDGKKSKGKRVKKVKSKSTDGQMGLL